MDPLLHTHSTVLILAGSVHNNGVSATRHRIRWIPLAFLTMAMSLSLGVPLALNEGVYNSHLWTSWTLILSLNSWYPTWHIHKICRSRHYPLLSLPAVCPLFWILKLAFNSFVSSNCPRLRQENPDLVFLLNRVIQLQKILKSGKRSYATFRYQYMELIFKVGT